jgi:hypothetical protein
MEKQSNNSDDNRDRRIPEREQLWPGEIDLTGAVDQDAALHDVISDAIIEAEASGGDVPDWGARTIARALANRLGSPPGALHHYAVTGNIHLPDLAAELAQLYESDDSEVQRWTTLLGRYLTNQPNTAAAACTGQAKPDSANTHDVGTPDLTQNQLVTEGLGKHGDAFRAYLTLPEIRVNEDILKNFQDLYIGSFDTMHDLLLTLTDMRRGMEEVRSAAEGWGLEEFVTLNEEGLAEAARAAWQVIDYQGKLHVFAN